MTDEYLWDAILPELMKLFTRWTEPLEGLSQRQWVATSIAMRAMRRCVATSRLFGDGFYLEATSLVRSAYEEWLYLAYVTNAPDDSRCNEFVQQIFKNDARVYDAFSSLLGTAAANELFGAEPPPHVAKYVGMPRGRTQGPTFASMADDVGLRPVHDYAYTYLSSVTHPDIRLDHIFDIDEPAYVAQVPTRNSHSELPLAIWMIWFTARIAVLACREFGIDQEWFCDEWLQPIATEKPDFLETAVLVREVSSGPPAPVLDLTSAASEVV